MNKKINVLTICLTILFSSFSYSQYDENNAHHVFEDRMYDIKDNWGKVNPRGTVVLPAKRLNAYKTIEVPPRVSLRGPIDQLTFQDMWGVYARLGKGFEGDWVIKSIVTPNNKIYNGNFDGHLTDLMVQALPGQCSNGVFWGGAQCSSVERVTIWDAENIALYIASGSTRFTLSQINIRNGVSSPSRKGNLNNTNLKEPRGIGIKTRNVAGLDGNNIALHLCKIGLDMYGSHCVSLRNIVLEKVDLAAVFNGCSTITIDGIDIEAPGEGNYSEGESWDRILFDFRDNHGNIDIKGRVRKVAQTPNTEDKDEIYYLDKSGNKVIFMFGSSMLTHNGMSFNISVRDHGETIKVDLNNFPTKT